VVKRALLFLFLVVVLQIANLCVAADTNSVSIPEFLNSISVTIETPESYGSGVAFNRKDFDGNPVTFIWTASHVVHYKEILDAEFLPLPILPQFENDTNDFFFETNEMVFDFTNVTIHQDIITNGVFCCRTNLPAQLIKISTDDIGEDLAIFRVKGQFFNTNSVVFDLSGRIPRLGEPLYGVSSPFGESGTFCTGFISSVGRNVPEFNRTFDETSCVMYPGSSGGGAFSIDGKFIGMYILIKAPGLSYINPMRRIQSWAKKENVEWALDPSIPMPSNEELKSLPVKDKELVNQQVTKIKSKSPSKHLK